MQIILETDYAIRIVHLLARNAERTDAGTIAGRTGVPPRFALKILRKLVAAGIVRSHQGSRGGFELAKNPQDITLRAVIEIIEGPIAFSRCLCDGYSCTHNTGPDSAEDITPACDDFCYFQQVFEDVSETLIKKLDAVNFSMSLGKK